ncbi:MAG: hypothetical protein IJM92_03570, partial [Fibrobacter sp.]
MLHFVVCQLEIENRYVFCDVVNSEKYIAIVEVLAQKKKGITRNTLIKELSVESSGGVSKALDDLENCG